MQIPLATYRVQLHSGFTFQQLKEIIPYLHQLGISTVYASPITQAVKGSMHGYDVTDPQSINPEIGTRQELEEIVALLKQYQMTWLQDIVPNHMAFDTTNKRLMDVLERGDQSHYRRFFDINWNHPDPMLHGKLMVPFLGSAMEEAVDKGELKLEWCNGKCLVKYFDTAYPLSYPAYRYLQMAGAANPQQAVAVMNERPAALKQLLQKQFYLLTWWKNSELQMDYRRFFTVNSLICLRMEERSVFDEYHPLIIELYKKGLIQGVRIDHIDGLYNPRGYVQQLRNALGDDAYIIAEKILEYKEPLPGDWALQGTSGYEFLAFTAQLLTNTKGSEQLLAFYKELVPQTGDYLDMVFEKKHHFLLDQMNGELDNLMTLLLELALVKEEDDIEELKEALGIWMAAFPVYRIYPEQLPLQSAEQQLVNTAFERGVKHAPGLQDGWRLLHALFEADADASTTNRKMLFLHRLMQFTGPLAAKGVEDTTFYVYNPLIAHNEVGDSPEQLGISVGAFHRKMQTRQQQNPLSLNATTTHDTKRGEDARMRIAVLSERATEWISKVKEWQQLNTALVQQVNNKRAPSVNDEYFIYQSLIGSFPQNLEVTDGFKERSHAFITKALREAKVATNYTAPDEGYEAACIAFIDNLLSPGHGFLQSFTAFLESFLDDAAQLSLVQTLIKLTAPGIPDIYQGCELWDHSYVDPDNRRPIDYTQRKALLQTLTAKEQAGKAGVLAWAQQEKRSGAQKLYLVQQTIQVRTKYNAVFTDGQYIPLTVSKERAAVAYARVLDKQWIIVVAPMGIEGVNDPAAFNDVLVQLPAGAPGTFTQVFTGETVQPQNGALSLPAILHSFPAGLLVG